MSRKTKYFYDRDWQKRNAGKWRKIAYRSRDKHLPAKEAIVSRAKDGGCIRCGEKEKLVLQFHHRDYKTKRWSIGSAYRNISIKNLKNEIKKCDVLCANCHIRVEHELGYPARRKGRPRNNGRTNNSRANKNRQLKLFD